MATVIREFTEQDVTRNINLLKDNCYGAMLKSFIKDAIYVWDFIDSTNAHYSYRETVFEWNAFERNVSVGDTPKCEYESLVIADMKQAGIKALSEQLPDCFKAYLSVAARLETETALWEYLEYKIFGGKPEYEY